MQVNINIKFKYDYNELTEDDKKRLTELIHSALFIEGDVEKVKFITID